MTRPAAVGKVPLQIQSKREKNNLYVKYRLTFNHKLLIFNKYEVRFAGDFNVGDS